MKKPRLGRAARVALICGVVLFGSLLTVPLTASNNHALLRSSTLGPPASAPFDHIVTIMMENQGLCDVYTGCGGSAQYMSSLDVYTGCGGSAQYMSSLANSNTLVMTWGTIGHNSEPNYISLIGGFDDTSTNNDGVCCFFENQNNIVDRIESAGLTWQAFAEDAGNTGTCSFSPPRSGDHFPFIDFSDMNTAARCSHFLTSVLK